MVLVPWVRQIFQALCFLTVRVAHTHGTRGWAKVFGASVLQAGQATSAPAPASCPAAAAITLAGTEGFPAPNHHPGQEAEGRRQSHK